MAGKEEATAALPAAPPIDAMRVFTGGEQPQKRAQADCRRAAGERVWAREYRSGARFYVCATQRAMYAFLVQKPDQDLYEIIEDPAAVPDAHAKLRFRTQSRLYLDVEFKRALNPDAPEDSAIVPPLVESLLAYVRKQLPRVARSHVARFTAHSERKFSEHVCIRLFDKDDRELWFEANWHAGALVRRWEYYVARNEFPQHFMCSDSKVRDVEFVIDKGVYTRNRIFRTGMATKRGESRMLVRVDAPAGEWRMPYDDWCAALSQDHDRAAGGRASCVLHMVEATGAPAASLAIFYTIGDLALGGEGAAAASASASNRAQKRRLQSSGGLLPPSEPTQGASKRARAQGTIAGEVVRWVQSLHPGLGVELRVANERALVVHTESRDCPIAGRQHASNKIYYVIDDLGPEYGDFVRLRCQLRCRDPNCPPPTTQVEIPMAIRQRFLVTAQLMQVLEDAR